MRNLLTAAIIVLLSACASTSPQRVETPGDGQYYLAQGGTVYRDIPWYGPAYPAGPVYWSQPWWGYRYYSPYFYPPTFYVSTWASPYGWYGGGHNAWSWYGVSPYHRSSYGGWFGAGAYRHSPYYVPRATSAWPDRRVASPPTEPVGAPRSAPPAEPPADYRRPVTPDARRSVREPLRRNALPGYPVQPGAGQVLQPEVRSPAGQNSAPLMSPPKSSPNFPPRTAPAVPSLPDATAGRQRAIGSRRGSEDSPSEHDQ